MSDFEVGIIGGSGLYNMKGLTDVEEIALQTPFGPPSDTLIAGRIDGRRVVFLPRHGRGHRLTPTEVPYRANIYALKSLGVRFIFSITACGSLREDYAPGHMVVPDQIFDRTTSRPRSFFGEGLVAHVSVADPFTPGLGRALGEAVRAAGGTVHMGGTLVVIEGPRFSTRGESLAYRSWGMSIIGMTASPEAFLAAEAEIAYASLAHVTDYDVWHESEEPVTVEKVIETAAHNTRVAQATIGHLLARYDDWAAVYPAHSGLKDALITDPARIPAGTREKLELLVGRYLPG